MSSVNEDYIYIKGENCTAADLGLVPETPSDMFYPLKPNQMRDLQYIVDDGTGFVCFDLGENKLMGDQRSEDMTEFEIWVEINE